MADIAGLVLGTAMLWESCVQIYELVDSARHHGIEYELLNIKYEVERVRLVCWGDAVGISGVLGQTQTTRMMPTQTAEGPVTHTARALSPLPWAQLDIRLSRDDVRDTVCRVLECVRHIFENADRLQDRYGLRIVDSDLVRGAGEPLTTQKRRVLDAVFKRTYGNFRRAAKERQQGSNLGQKTVWAVHDRKQFGSFVTELRGFNDSLESLFPNAQLKIAEVMRNDINSAVELRDLQLLHEAMSEDHEDLSELASCRLEALGATVSARTELLYSLGSELGGGTAEEANPISTDDLRVPDSDSNNLPAKAHVDELTNRLNDVDLYTQKKASGALVANTIGPFSASAHVSAHVCWLGRDSSSKFYGDTESSFSSALHASFAPYKRKKYMKRNPSRWESEPLDSEDYILLDPESHVKYESISPGTVTVEGYGLECWDFEETKPREMTVLVNHAKLPVLPARKILRRLADLQENRTGVFGWYPVAEECELQEFVGKLSSFKSQERDYRISDLYSILNRSDVFVDFTSESSVSLHSVGRGSNSGVWDFLRQIIVAWELSVRLKTKSGDSYYNGFTPQILAALIVSDLWLKSVKIVLRDVKPSILGIKRPETEAEKATAEDLKNKGNAALKKGDFQAAADLYAKAIEIDNGNAVYHSNYSAALVGLEKFEDAGHNAHVATILDPTYAKAWSRLGMAAMKLGQPKRAKGAYEKALNVSGKEATSQMRRGLANAEDEISRVIAAINAEKNDEKLHKLRSDFLDQDYETLGRSAEFHSLVHEQQVEGLLLFAERMQWPYINEVRDYAEDVYGNLRGGQTVGIDLHDWLFGLTLPGKWFSFKIMTALILCTPSIRAETGISRYYECGLALPTRSYWRVRTALGRVIGCLPGVTSLCGWIGPCPSVEFDPPVKKSKPRHVRIKARRIALTQHVPDSGHDVVVLGNSFGSFSATEMRPTEEIEPYLADIRQPSNWVVPEPPVRDMSTCQIQSIKLKQFASDVGIARGASNDDREDLEAELEAQYRVNISFKIDNNQSPVAYKLYTNPVFVTLPPCESGPHPVHMRELQHYQMNIWTIDKLQDHTAEAVADEDVMVINATGKGAEPLARAWCSERGKCALIRRAGGPCFVCAVRAASRKSLNTGVLIWVE